MDFKVYKKTRYQNIYKHKNGNYVIRVNVPVDSTISRINNEKIWSIDEALKIRDNPKIKAQKKAEIIYKDNFDELWNKYINYCIYEEKQAYNTYHKKEIIYCKYIKNHFTKKISKYTKEDYAKYINNLNTTDTMKNHILKYIKTFLNWCVRENYIIMNPTLSIKKYKVPKAEMKYWLPEHIKKILNIINKELDESTSPESKQQAYIIKMLIIIGFSLGDRIGETRALQFENISEEHSTIQIKHSINYNSKASNYLSTPKTDSSGETLQITKKLLNEIIRYKSFLKNELNYKVKNDTPILVNIKTNRPYSDSRLRELFNHYIKIAKVPKIRMYDLRHTLATTLMSEGYDMYDIQDRLRHKSIRTTIDRYGHITLNKRKKVAKITDKYY